MPRYLNINQGNDRRTCTCTNLLLETVGTTVARKPLSAPGNDLKPAHILESHGKATVSLRSQSQERQQKAFARKTAVAQKLPWQSPEKDKKEAWGQIVGAFSRPRRLEHQTRVGCCRASCQNIHARDREQGPPATGVWNRRFGALTSHIRRTRDRKARLNAQPSRIADASGHALCCCGSGSTSSFLSACAFAR